MAPPHSENYEYLPGPIEVQLLLIEIVELLRDQRTHHGQPEWDSPPEAGEIAFVEYHAKNTPAPDTHLQPCRMLGAG